MTYAQLVEFEKVTVDEIGGIAPFYSDPADYDESLNESQRQTLGELMDRAEYRSMRSLIVVQESVADGGTLAHHCLVPYSCYDAVNGLNVTLRSRYDFMTYQNVTTANFEQAYIENDILHTQPAGLTLLVNYLRPPLVIGAGQTSELSIAVHPMLALRGTQILIHKDIDAPAQEYIEAWRNKLAVYKTGKLDPNAQGFFPTQIPYQNR